MIVAGWGIELPTQVHVVLLVVPFGLPLVMLGFAMLAYFGFVTMDSIAPSC
jgi:hypothetical protein